MFLLLLFDHADHWATLFKNSSNPHQWLLRYYSSCLLRDLPYDALIIHHFLLFHFYVNSFLFCWPPLGVLYSSSSSAQSLSVGIHQHFISSLLFLSLRKGNFILFYTFIHTQSLISFKFVSSARFPSWAPKKNIVFTWIIATCGPIPKLLFSALIYSSAFLCDPRLYPSWPCLPYTQHLSNSSSSPV